MNARATPVAGVVLAAAVGTFLGGVGVAAHRTGAQTLVGAPAPSQSPSDFTTGDPVPSSDPSTVYGQPHVVGPSPATAPGATTVPTPVASSTDRIATVQDRATLRGWILPPDATWHLDTSFDTTTLQQAEDSLSTQPYISLGAVQAFTRGDGTVLVLFAARTTKTLTLQDLENEVSGDGGGSATVTTSGSDAAGLVSTGGLAVAEGVVGQRNLVIGVALAAQSSSVTLTVAQAIALGRAEIPIVRG